MFPANDVEDEMPDQAASPGLERGRPEYDAFVRFAGYTRECRQLERRVKELKAKMEALEYQLRDYLGAQGFQKVTVAGFTIYLRRDVWVRARDRVRSEEVCAVLKANGMGHFVHEAYSTSSLTSHVRQLEELHEKELESGKLASVADLLPPMVAAVLNMDPKYNIIALEKATTGRKRRA